MKPHIHDQKGRIPCQFDSFCKKVMRYEARHYFRDQKRQRAHEISFEELSQQEIEQLVTTDDYFSGEYVFNVLGDEIIVRDNEIAEALANLPDSNREIVLLSYFLGLTDREIGERLNMIRRTVSRHRSKTLAKLKEILEENNGQEE
ncbi:RNA polymerase sigma factor [Christensenella intestinihominis]|uniref:RNA polymerase sigma factor n=1 Tax=Christensenella intestinihominis TaxID=1851429 RepID=UPI00082CE066|nr:sigma-70 family RNA polymerase sigma factor [Christensenella intestinihominis]